MLQGTEEISTSKPSLLILKANYLKKRVNANLKSTLFMGSNNYNNYIETYTTKKAVNEVRIYASQSTYYYIQRNLHYATYREKDLN